MSRLAIVDGIRGNWKANLLKSTFKIVNVVATAQMDQPIPLECLPELFPRMIVYDPTAYQAPAPAYFKSREMKGKISIFPSGKIISVGTGSEEKAHQEIQTVAKRLEDVGMGKLKTQPQIQNIVAAGSVGSKLDLNRICSSTELKGTYDPEIFPGATFRVTIPSSLKKATILVFSSGKFVCLGLRRSEDVCKVVEMLLEMISRSQSMRYKEDRTKAS